MEGATLDFEQPIVELERKILELEQFSSDGQIDLSDEIKKLKSKLADVQRRTFDGLSAWQRVQIARHPRRPYFLDYLKMLNADFLELHGDRCFADDRALVGGLATINEQRMMVIGHQKGRDTKENLERNFGSAHPEGYRKALRLVHMAEKAQLPVLCMIDTPGAYPGIGAEERGQAMAIAESVMEQFVVRTPIVVVVIGEGGSGGALGIGIGDRVLVLEHAYYSVISPEGCAAILWKDRARAADAAEALRLTAKDLLKLGLIDQMVPEPLGGAHRDPEGMAHFLWQAVSACFEELAGSNLDDLVNARYEKFRHHGQYIDAASG